MYIVLTLLFNKKSNTNRYLFTLMIRQLPNFLTLMNLFSGCIAIVFAFQAEFEITFWFLALGIFFDFWDGFLARKLGVSGALGVQLDSLADMVTSGVVPGLVMFVYLNSFEWFSTRPFLPYLGFIITLGACVRLARFNIDTRQTTSFIGLPTPANALWVVSLPLLFDQSLPYFIQEWIYENPYVLFVFIVLSAYLMNAEMPLFSLKINKAAKNAFLFPLMLIVLSIVLLIWLSYAAMPLIILLYILLSLVKNSFSKSY